MTKEEIYNKLRETFHSKSGCFLSKKSCDQLASKIRSYAETDYLLHSKVNKEHLMKAVTETLGKKVYKQMNDTIEQTVFGYSEEEKKYYQGFSYNKITPHDLLELGFKEEYQPTDMGDVGFIYYNLKVMDLDLTSVETTDPDFRVLIGDGEFPIRDLKQLSDLINILEEVEGKKEEK
jgi:hypothetical protein